MRRRPALYPGVINVADLSSDTRARRALRGGRDVELTAKEYALLKYLARRADEVVGRADIAEHVWDESYDPFSKVIEVFIQRLRRKVDDGHALKLIRTRRGEGYTLTARGPTPMINTVRGRFTLRTRRARAPKTAARASALPSLGGSRRPTTATYGMPTQTAPAQPSSSGSPFPPVTDCSLNTSGVYRPFTGVLIVFADKCEVIRGLSFKGEVV